MNVHAATGIRNLETWAFSCETGTGQNCRVEERVLLQTICTCRIEERGLLQTMLVFLPPPPPPHTLTYALLCRGANHFNQTDVLFVLPKFIVRNEKFRSVIDPEVAHAVNLEICHAFLKRYLLLGELLLKYQFNISKQLNPVKQ